jgi:hypothetical protein
VPDILRVRFLGDLPGDVPLAGRVVEPDTVFELPGKIVADDEAADHVVVEVGNPPDIRLLQRALFRVENPPKARARKED